MNSRIKVFKQEKIDGVAEQVRACASIAYATQLEPLDPASNAGQRIIKAFASAEHPSETLYPMKDILVTTGRNLNFDIFENGETWIARNTSIHHPLNFEHNEKHIIGCITSSQVVDDDMQAIAEDSAIDELPDKFHILNGSVIYRVWSDEEQQKLIDTTIAEIERGEWFVSMECVFRGFDYGVTRPDGTSGVIARNEESAFLTKHLKQYGGNGIYKDKKSGDEFQVGRVLRNISFSGKGLVRKPANPESVILNHVSAFVSTSANLEYIKTEAEVTTEPLKSSVDVNPEITNMPDITPERVKSLEDQVADLTRQLSDKDTKVAQATIDSLKDDVKQRDNRIEALQASVDTLNETVTDLKTRAENAETAHKDLEDKYGKIVAEKLAAERYNALVGKGASQEKAKDYVEKMAHFSDEDFNFFVENASAAWKPAKPPVRTPEKVLTTVKPEPEAALASKVEDEDESKEVREKTSAFINSYLKYNKTNQD